MSIDTDTFSLDLPLSWTRSKIKSVQKKSLSFKTNKIHWISLAHIPENQNFKYTVHQLRDAYPEGILLRGCSRALAYELKRKNFEILAIGQEAIIELNKDLIGRKLKQSVRCGHRHNSIRKIKMNEENIDKLNDLKRKSPYGKKPQLKNLFIDSFNNHTECFIAENKKGWNGAITFSHVNHHRVQAELLVRNSNAPSGTMEALIEQVIIYLRQKGYLYLSLGEVPFELNNIRHQSVKSRLVCRTGRTMHFAYNSGTLYKFKNKFSPCWQPVFLCGYPKISILSLFELGIRTNYLTLIMFQLVWYGKKSVKKIFTGRGID